MIDNKTNILHHTGTHTVTKTKLIASLSRNVCGVQLFVPIPFNHSEPIDERLKWVRKYFCVKEKVLLALSFGIEICSIF